MNVNTMFSAKEAIGHNELFKMLVEITTDGFKPVLCKVFDTTSTTIKVVEVTSDRTKEKYSIKIKDHSVINADRTTASLFYIKA